MDCGQRNLSDADEKKRVKKTVSLHAISLER